MSHKYSTNFLDLYYLQNFLFLTILIEYSNLLLNLPHQRTFFCSHFVMGCKANKESPFVSTAPYLEKDCSQGSNILYICPQSMYLLLVPSIWLSNQYYASLNLLM